MILNILLQTGITTAEASEEVANTVESVGLWQLILAGGWVMIPLFILSLISVYLFVERFLTVKAANKISPNFVENVKSDVLSGNIDDALSLCVSENTPASRMIEKGISRIGSPLKDIEAAIENVGKIEINRLEKNLSSLATIAGVGPMIGFLGTVMGMIQAFITINNEGVANVASMSKGIYEAMVTTAGGLIVGVIAYIAYNYLTAAVQKVIHKMEHASIEFIDLLQEPSKKG